MISIDGKTIKGASTDQHPVHIVSAFASEEGTLGAGSKGESKPSARSGNRDGASGEA